MGEYVDLGGKKTWFDSWGSGSPLVLLHGDFVSNDMWGPTAPALAGHFEVLAPERRVTDIPPTSTGP
jgi:pimeloyl-ACP methyl ester carboxylesterase